MACSGALRRSGCCCRDDREHRQLGLSAAPNGSTVRLREHVAAVSKRCDDELLRRGKLGADRPRQDPSRDRRPVETEGISRLSRPTIFDAERVLVEDPASGPKASPMQWLRYCGVILSGAPRASFATRSCRVLTRSAAFLRAGFDAGRHRRRDASPAPYPKLLNTIRGPRRDRRSLWNVRIG